jgi:Mrp family chromosome partitioning ATPase
MILIADAGRMTKLSPADLRAIKSHTQEVTPGVFELSDQKEIPEPSSPNYEAILHSLRKEFGYILIDCAPLRKGSDAIALAPATDGLLLVVAAGKTKRTKIEQAQKLIERSSGRLLGCILNKRTYPVPNFLYKQL